MTVTETLGALGSWSVTLSDEAPVGTLAQLGYFGHVAVFRGQVDVTGATDTDLLQAARYVGVLREKASGGRALSGNGMLFWLGDEDHKGKVFESKLVLTGRTLGQCLTAILPPAVTVGTVHDPGGTYTGTHQWQTPRDVLDVVCTAFGVEYRVNGDGSLDVGTAAQLYNTTAPDSIVSARGAGADFDLRAIGGTFDTDTAVIDYSTRIVLLGQATDGSTDPFATGTADAPSVPYKDIHGHPVTMTRMISESGQTTGSVTARAQLQLNRFNRTTQALTVTAADYEMSGNFVVGDSSYVYDPDNAIYDPTREVTFRGEVLHPAVVRISGITWPVTNGHTVAFRTQDGVWIDLTRWVVWETGTNQVTVGDLPKTLTSSSNPVLDQTNSAPDASVPGPPTGLALTTTSVESSVGQSTATITAAWTAPATNTDGSVITDLSYYEVRYRWHGRAPLWDTRYASTTTIDITGLAVGLVYDVEVAAVDLTGHQSAFTGVASITAAPDSTAPNPPSDPVVTSYLGQLRISWDGKDNTGAAMPPDFAIVEVHVSATSGFTPAAGPGSSTLVSQLSTGGVAYATAPYAAARYVKLVSVDNSGNRSAPSNQVSGVTVQVADGDVASLSVGKLTAGTMSADVVVGGRFATALTGARVEMNSLGFQKFDTDGVTKLVSITGTEALLTGIYKTATTGRRIEIGASGATGRLNFYAPDGTNSFLLAYTESTGLEAMQFGIPISGVSNTLWNRINYNNDHNGWANYRANKHEFVMGGANSASGADSSSPGVFHVFQTSTYGNGPDTTVLALSPTDGTRLYGVAPWKGNPPVLGGNVQILGPNAATESAFLTLWTPAQPSNGQSYGGLEFFSMDSPGANERFEFKHWDGSVYISLWASAFTVSSSVDGKDDIADYTMDAMAAIRPVKVKSYRRKPGKDMQDGPKEIGLIAEEAPAQIVTLSNGAPHGVDLYQTVALEWAAIQQLDARLDALEKGGKK